MGSSNYSIDWTHIHEEKVNPVFVEFWRYFGMCISKFAARGLGLGRPAPAMLMLDCSAPNIEFLRAYQLLSCGVNLMNALLSRQGQQSLNATSQRGRR